MYPLNDYSYWIINADTPFGSGASEKHWLINEKTGETGIFKFPKSRVNGMITGEYWAEKLAYEIAKCIGFGAAKVEIGIYDGRKGSMSYMIINSDEELIEGIQYITKYFPNYNSDRFEDDSSGNIYSIQMVMQALADLGEQKKEFMFITLFDCLIGNSDRHHSNWAMIKNRKTEKIRFSPVYDNGSSLCCYVNPNSIHEFLNDRLKFKSLIYGKSKSLIGWNGQKQIRHFDLFEKLLQSYFEECSNFVEKIKSTLTDEKIYELVYNFEETIIDQLTKELIIKFLCERRNFMIEKYEIREEANDE